MCVMRTHLNLIPTKSYPYLLKPLRGLGKKKTLFAAKSEVGGRAIYTPSTPCGGARAERARRLSSALLDARGGLPSRSSGEAQLQAQPRSGRQRKGRREAGAPQGPQTQLAPSTLGLGLRWLRGFHRTL